ncbi:hypothetical protein KIPB_010985 [Kipferlia bialata]|uniref:Uncharacterized protein n=1 Tax=Kipferlia bialata TaxID=797122 RepID=A0A391NQ78_9EUKA|nr:hypothetical protein KIPB_010985 [Kipferlia bialata]|eukprot:g10985.t1
MMFRVIPLITAAVAAGSLYSLYDGGMAAYRTVLMDAIVSGPLLCVKELEYLVWALPVVVLYLSGLQVVLGHGAISPRQRSAHLMNTLLCLLSVSVPAYLYLLSCDVCQWAPLTILTVPLLGSIAYIHGTRNVFPAYTKWIMVIRYSKALQCHIGPFN